MKTYLQLLTCLLLLLSSCTSYTSGVKVTSDTGPGHLGQWQFASSSVPINDTGMPFRAIEYNGWMYAVSFTENTTVRAPILSDGDIGQWISDTSLLPTGSYQDLLQYNNYLYAVNFTNGDILKTDIQSDHSLGVWQTVSTLPLSPCTQSTILLISDKWMYEIAPLCNFNNAYTISCLSAQSSQALLKTFHCMINQDGSLGSWISDTSIPFTPWMAVSPTITIPYGVTSIAIGNRIYLLGGGLAALFPSTSSSGSFYSSLTPLSSPSYAAIGVDGSVGDWITDTNASLTINPVSIIGAATYNNWLYVLYGMYEFSTSTLSFFDGVQRIQINTDGSLNKWIPSMSTNLGAPFATMAGVQFVQYNGYLYTLGGYTFTTEGYNMSLSPTGTVEYTKIYP